MDERLRQLEREAAADPAALPQLLNAAASAGVLDRYRQHLPLYFREVNPGALDESLRQLRIWPFARPGSSTAIAREIVKHHLLQHGSGNFSGLGFGNLEVSLAVPEFLKQYGFQRGLVITNTWNIGRVFEVLEASDLDPQPFQEGVDRDCGYDVISRHYLSKRNPSQNHYEVVIADGAKFLHWPKTRQTQEAIRLAEQAVYRIAITCTPYTRRSGSIQSLIRFMDPETTVGGHLDAAHQLYHRYGTTFEKISEELNLAPVS